MGRSVSVLICAGFLAASCGFGGQSDKAPLDLSISAGGLPRIQIVSPKSGATVHGGKTGDERSKVTIVTRVSGFKLVDKIGKTARPGEGHIIFYRLESADARVPTKKVKGKTALIGGRGAFTSYPTAETTYAWQYMPSVYFHAGVYSFVVQLVGNDNNPLVPPKLARVTVDVQR